MRVAIASTGNTLDARICEHFGRCDYFIIYDTNSKAIEYIPNPYKYDDYDAGIKSVELVTTRNISKIISGEFGLKIKPMLDKLKIQLIVVKDHNKKISNIIELLNQ